jgi:hypothetical protein
MARNTRIFADLDINFRSHPATGDVTMRYDEEAIKQSIKNLVMTNHYERPFHPEIGSQLRSLLFEPASPLLVISLKQAITNTINNFEPRVNLIGIDINFKPDNNTIHVVIQFTIINTNRPIVLNLVLERTR